MTFTTFLQFGNLKFCTFCTLKIYIYIFEKNGFQKKLNETSLYFLTSKDRHSSYQKGDINQICWYLLIIRTIVANITKREHSVTNAEPRQRNNIILINM